MTSFRGQASWAQIPQLIETSLEHAPFVVLVDFFPHLNIQKPADYGPQQH